MIAMQFLEIKAKVKSGKETEFNQVINDLIPHFKNLKDVKSQINYNEMDGELSLKLGNGNSSKKIENVLKNDHFILLLGSLKVLCDEYTLDLPNEYRS